MKKFLGLMIMASFIAIPAQEEITSLKNNSSDEYSCPCKKRKRNARDDFSISHLMT